MAIEGEIITYLKAQSTLTALVKQKTYYKNAPQGIKPPYVVMTRTSNPKIPTEVGIEGENPVYSFKIVGASAVSMVAIADALTVILKYNTTAALSSLSLYICIPLGSRDITEDLDTEDNTHVRIDDYQFEYQDLS